MRELARCSASAAAPSTEAARLLLLLPPLFLALLVGGGHHTVDASVCDTANCGMGNCSETPVPVPVPVPLPLLPNYTCHCDPGWSNALKLIPFSPCIVPNCSFNNACLNVGLTPPPPTATLNICSVVSCGAGGTCTPHGDPLSFRYSCECHPGYANLLNITTLPCVNCFLGDACYDLGLGPPPPAPAPARPDPAPSGDHNGTSEPPAHPSGTKGSVSSPSLRQLLLLLLVSVAVDQVV